MRHAPLCRKQFASAIAGTTLQMSQAESLSKYLQMPVYLPVSATAEYRTSPKGTIKSCPAQQIRRQQHSSRLTSKCTQHSRGRSRRSHHSALTYRGRRRAGGAVPAAHTAAVSVTAIRTRRQLYHRRRSLREASRVRGRIHHGRPGDTVETRALIGGTEHRTRTKPCRRRAQARQRQGDPRTPALPPPPASALPPLPLASSSFLCFVPLYRPAIPLESG